MAPAVFTSCNVEIGGLRFHYTDWGGDGPPLLLEGTLAARVIAACGAPLAPAAARHARR